MARNESTFLGTVTSKVGLKQLVKARVAYLSKPNEIVNVWRKQSAGKKWLDFLVLGIAIQW